MEPCPQPKPGHRYTHFDRSFGAELALFILFVPALLTLWIFAAYYYYYTGRISFHISNTALFYTFMFLYTLFFYRNYRRDSRYKMIFVEKDKIIKRGVSRQTTLGFADITGIRRSWNPFAGMWIVFESASKEPLKIPVRMRNGHEMVGRVFGTLEENGLFFEGMASLGRKFYEASKRFNIRQSLRAMYMQNLARAVTAAAIFSGAVALIFWERGLAAAFICGFFNMLLQAAAYFVTEEIHVKKLIGGKEERVRRLIDGDREAVGDFTGYYVIAGMAALLLWMAFGEFMLAFGEIVLRIVFMAIAPAITPMWR